MHVAAVHSKAVILVLFVLSLLFLPFCVCVWGSCLVLDLRIVLCVLSSFAIIFMKKRDVCFAYCIQAPTENYFSYFSTKTYVVGTQNNRLNETVLLSTHNTCFKLIGKKIIAILR